MATGCARCGSPEACGDTGLCKRCENEFVHKCQAIRHKFEMERAQKVHEAIQRLSEEYHRL